MKQKQKVLSLSRAFVEDQTLSSAAITDTSSVGVGAATSAAGAGVSVGVAAAAGAAIGVGDFDFGEKTSCMPVSDAAAFRADRNDLRREPFISESEKSPCSTN